MYTKFQYSSPHLTAFRSDLQYRFHATYSYYFGRTSFMDALLLGRPPDYLFTKGYLPHSAPMMRAGGACDWNTGCNETKQRRRRQKAVGYSNCVQGSAKRLRPGLVNFDGAVAYHFCLSLPAAFSQPGRILLADPCRSFVRRRRHLAFWALGPSIYDIFSKYPPSPKSYVLRIRKGNSADSVSASCYFLAECSCHASTRYTVGCEYPAFDQNSGPEISGHLAGSRNKHIYFSLDGRWSGRTPGSK